MSRPAPPGTPWERLLSEPRRPPWIRHSRWAPWLAVGTVCIGAFMGQLDASIVTVALPTISRQLHVGLGAVEWVVLAYIVVLVGAVAVVGRIADSAGRKLLYTYGFAVFAAASAGCAFSPSLPVLVACRLIQGFGAAMLQANSLALIRDVAPAGRLGAAVGIQGAAQAVGLAAGPAIGGVLIAAGGWPLIFLVNVPIGAVAIVLAWLLLPRSRNLALGTAIDIPGAALLAGTAACLLATLSLAVEKSVPAGALAALASGTIVVGTAAVLRQRRHPGAVVDSALLHDRGFRVGAASGLLAYAALFGTLLVVPFFLESGLGVDARGAGLRLTVLPLVLAVVAPLGGRLADRRGPRLPTVAGMALTAAGLALFASGGGEVRLIVALAIAGAGLGLYIPANNAALVGAAPQGRAGSASGLTNVVRGLGTAIGIALAGLTYGLVARTSGRTSVAAAQAMAGAHAGGAMLALVALAAGVVAARRGARPDGARVHTD